jgi:hypothetical protein
MTKLAENIIAHMKRLSEGTSVGAKEFLHLGARAAIDQALSRLVRRNVLLRAGRGAYVLPVETRFGMRATFPPNSSARRNARESWRTVLRQHAIGDGSVIGARQAPQVGTRPNEVVPFRYHNPGTSRVEMQALFHLGWHLDGKAWMFGRGVGDRQRQHAYIAAFVRANGGDDRARAILLAFFASFDIFAMPEIGVTNDETGNRFGKRHAPSLQFVVKEGEFVGDLGVEHRLTPLLGKVGGQTGAPVAALETFPFLR